MENQSSYQQEFGDASPLHFLVVVHSKVDKLRAIKAGQLFWVGEVKEDGWEFSVGGRMEEDGSIAV